MPPPFKVLSVPPLPSIPTASLDPRCIAPPSVRHIESVQALNRRTAEVVVAAADTLCLSCLYFTRENLAALGTPIDLAAQLETLDPLMRAALADCQMNMGEQAHPLTVTDCWNDLSAGVEAARLAAQLFGLLRDAKLPPSGMMPLRNVTDAAARAIRAAGAALLSGKADAVRAACAALAEAERMEQELLTLLPGVATYQSLTLCRIIRAALMTVLIAAERLTVVAARLTLPILTELREVPSTAPSERYILPGSEEAWGADVYRGDAIR